MWKATFWVQHYVDATSIASYELSVQILEYSFFAREQTFLALLYYHVYYVKLYASFVGGLVHGFIKTSPQWYKSKVGGVTLFTLNFYNNSGSNEVILFIIDC